MRQKEVSKLSEEIYLPFTNTKNSLGHGRFYLLRAEVNLNKKNYDTASIKIRNCIEIAQELKQNNLLADAYFTFAMIFQGSGSSDSTLAYLTKALMVATEYNLKPQEALAKKGLGYYSYFVEGDFKKAKQKYIESISISEESNFALISANTYRSLGIIYRRNLQQDSSIYYTKKSLVFYDSLKINRGSINSYISLANIFSKIGNRKMCIAYLAKAEAIALKQASCADFLPVIYNNWGSIIPIDQVSERKRYFLKCIEKSKEFKNERLEAFGCINLGEVYAKENNFFAGQREINNSIRILSKLKSKSISAIANRILVDFHLNWKKSKPNEFAQYAKKIDYVTTLNNAENIFRSNKDYTELKNIYRTYINFYENTNLSKLSKYQNDLIAVQDSIFELNSVKEAYKYLEGVNTAEKEKDIIQLKAEKEIDLLEKKQLLLGGILLLLITGAIAYYFLQRTKQKNKEEQEKRSVRLRHKLANDLHDEVGSNLSGLVMLAEGISLSENPPKASVDKLATLSRRAMVTMRDTVWAIDSRKDSVEDLVYRMLDYTKGYFEESNIEATVNHDIEDDEKILNSELRQNIYLLFKEALNNVAKHSKGDKLDITIDQKSDFLNLVIYNNGEVNKQINTSGLGMQSMRERAETFGGTFSINTDDGFKLEARFPI